MHSKTLHIETLQEIDIEYWEIAKEARVENFYRIPTLNIYPVFIDSLAKLVTKSLSKIYLYLLCSYSS
ncbi:ferrochelatase [cyanobacterium endosymbiont of Rhopalodia gibberula]|uniref:ferrochelatase n=1 Tax=cyanobacterium endosymbiont of Rhopalodia gibberula TaxID=1763363 RepID=UPI003B837F35